MSSSPLPYVSCAVRQLLTQQSLSGGITCWLMWQIYCLLVSSNYLHIYIYSDQVKSGHVKSNHFIILAGVTIH